MGDGLLQLLIRPFLNGCQDDVEKVIKIADYGTAFRIHRPTFFYLI